MKNVLWAAVFISTFQFAGLAQDTEHETHGSITAGYRFTDVKGREQKFAEFFNLRDGFRLHDVNVYGRAAGANPFFDLYSVTATGIGGEPFAGGQFKLSKDRSYDLRVNYRQTYFYWDRNDQASQPTGLNGLTTNHDWATVRKFGSANLTTYASETLRFSFDYHRTSRDGMTYTTRTLEYFGAPSTFPAFLRANPYVVQAPLNEISNRFTAGVSYAWRDWNFFYKAGYQTYEESLTMDNLGAGQRSINVDEAATANERVNTASWAEFRRLKTPVSEFAYNGRAGSRVRLRGGYIFYRYQGPAALNAGFAGSARTTSATVVAPYSVSLNNRVQVHEPNHVVDQGFTVELNDMFSFHTDYRYSRFTIDSHGSFEGVQSAAIIQRGETDVEWRNDMHNLEAAIEIAPRPNLLIRPGVRLMKRDVTVLHEGILEPQASRISKIVSPLATIYYAPSPRFSVRADIQNTTNGGPYTRISPRTDFNTRMVVRYAPTDRISIENNFKIRESEYTTTSFKNKVRANATTIRYTPEDRFSVFGGFTYDTFLATASIQFIRGTAPLNATWRDQTINRVWQAGFEAKPAANLTLTFSGNYDRTTGAGEISGDLPAYGPLRWPLATGTAAYSFGNLGQLSIDLQRTYYIEELIRDDNFSANLLGIRWTKEF